jgi:hypothetical protein
MTRTTTGAIDRTDQGEKPTPPLPKHGSPATTTPRERVLPSGERSAQQAAMAREARWRGRSGRSVAQKEPGGMFEALDTAAEPELPL